MNYKSFPIGIHINENSVKMLDGIVQNDDGNLFQVQLYSGTKAYDFSGYSLINATIVRPDETVIADIWPLSESGETTTAEEEEAVQDVIVQAAEDEDTTSDTASGDDEETVTEGSHTFLAIQHLDPENGRITLKVGGMATSMVGLHRMALEIYSSDARVTTARINYRVVESLNNVDESILTTDENYVALQSLLSECANIIAEEQERSNQEAQRQDEYASLAAQMRDEIESAHALFDQALAQGQLDELKEYLEGYVAELVGPIINYAPYVASAAAPAETRSLWIDTGNGNQLKYYNGSGWVTIKAIAIFG